VINDYSNLAQEKGNGQSNGKCPVYIVVTPAFNEEKNIQSTIQSMILQTVRPRIWVIVDDGSSDKTWELVCSTSKLYPWIRCHRRPWDANRGKDGLLTASEAKAFLEGLKLALDVCPNPEFVVKLDADLKFEANYFMAIFDEFAHDSQLGIAGGVIYEYKGEKLIREEISTAHVRGATKIYRAKCYKNIGGVRPVFGWDVIDEILALDSGWRVSSYKQVHLVHLRRTASRGGRFMGWARNGYMAYYIGMSPLRLLLRSLFRLVVFGDVIQSLGLVCGYFENYFCRTGRLGDLEILNVVKKYQWVTAKKVCANIL
jgi:poly-beta-1,6-N-acetyl-D-glucosamine synthase